MKIKAEFAHGMCRLVITPEDKWEQKLMGAVAKGGDALEARVEYETAGHFGHGECTAVRVLLDAAVKAETT
jgi:hypothetical protein